MRIPTLFVLWLAGLSCLSGCGDTTPQRRNSRGVMGGAGLVDPDLAPVPAAAAPAAKVPAGTSDVASQPSGQVPPGVAPSASALPGGATAASPAPGLTAGAPVSPGTVTEPAAPGVTGKGNYKPGLLSTPISVYFRAQEKLMFDQVKHAIDIFQATNGYKPRSHEEFMKEIIETSQPVLKLPKLPEGHTYKYDPQRGELMVEHPGP